MKKQNQPKFPAYIATENEEFPLLYRKLVECSGLLSFDHVILGGANNGFSSTAFTRQSISSLLPSSRCFS